MICAVAYKLSISIYNYTRSGQKIKHTLGCRDNSRSTSVETTPVSVFSPCSAEHKSQTSALPTLIVVVYPLGRLLGANLQIGSVVLRQFRSITNTLNKEMLEHRDDFS